MAASGDIDTAVNATSQSSVPSIALHIARKNGEHCREACSALIDYLSLRKGDDFKSQPLHDLVFAAATSKQC